MKLFYDMLIPFMPDSGVNEQGEVVPDTQKIEGRRAMAELSDFQKTGNILCLYNSVYHVCLYSGVNLYDKLLNLPEDINIPNISIKDAVHMCAEMLFRSSDPNAEEAFDVDKYICIILTAAHYALESLACKSSEIAKTGPQ